MGPIIFDEPDIWDIFVKPDTWDLVFLPSRIPGTEYFCRVGYLGPSIFVDSDPNVLFNYRARVSYEVKEFGDEKVKEPYERALQIKHNSG